jgi:MFS family permease
MQPGGSASGAPSPSRHQRIARRDPPLPMVDTAPAPLAAHPAGIEDAALERRIFSSAAIRILPLLMFAFLFAFIDRVNVAFAKLQMTGDLHLSGAVYGLGAGVFFLGYFIFEIPSNMILSRVGARLWIGRIMVTWGIISGLTAFVATPTEFYVARFLLGVAEAGLIPGIIYYTSNWFPGHWRGRIWGVFYIALASAGLIGGPLSGSILGYMSGALGIAGWKWLFIVEAVPSVIGGILVFFLLPDHVRDAAWLTELEKSHALRLLAAEQGGKRQGGVLRLLVNPWIIALCVIYFVVNLAVYGVGFWTPTLIQRMGVHDVVTIGWLSALPSLCAIITLLVLGQTADHFRERRWHLVTLFSLGIIGLVLSVLFQHDVTIGVASLCLISMGTITVPSMFWSVPTAMLGGLAAASGIAFINAVGNLSGFFGPSIIGYVQQSTGSPDDAIYFLAAMMALGILLILCLPARYVTNLGRR